MLTRRTILAAASIRIRHLLDESTPEGARETEEDDVRVTEEGDTRVVEGDAA